MRHGWPSLRIEDRDPIATFIDVVLYSVGAGVAGAIIVGSIIVLLLYSAPPTLGQEHHAQHHAFYQNWINGRGKGCCNDQDCGALADSNERTTAGQLEVRIEGEWCPVYAWHYLQKGNAPDWQSAHVCVVKKTEYSATGPCERLLCYQPKPLF